MSPDNVAGGNINFSNALEAAKLQLEAIKTLGQYKLAIAQAELVQAVANGEKVKARARQIVVDELQRAFQTLTKQRAKIDKEIAKWGQIGRDVSLIQDGESISRLGVTKMWQAFTLLSRLATIQTNEEIEGTAISSTERRLANYTVIKSAGREPLAEDVPADIENLAMLVQWLKEQKNVVPRKGRRPFALVRNAFLKIAGMRAQDEIKTLMTLMEGIEKRTLDAWKPVMLAPFLDNDAVKALTTIKPADK